MFEVVVLRRAFLCDFVGLNCPKIGMYMYALRYVVAFLCWVNTFGVLGFYCCIRDVRLHRLLCTYTCCSGVSFLGKRTNCYGLANLRNIKSDVNEYVYLERILKSLPFKFYKKTVPTAPFLHCHSGRPLPTFDVTRKPQVNG